MDHEINMFNRLTTNSYYFRLQNILDCLVEWLEKYNIPHMASLHGDLPW